MSDPFVGEIRPVAFNYAPIDWAQCAGQQVQIAQNQALYSLLGTIYGGDPGRGYFNLPNLSGRVMVGAGRSQSGNTYTVGQFGGYETVTLVPSNIPMHTHTASVTGTVTGTINVSGEAAVIQDAAGAMIALGKAGTSTVTGYKKDSIDPTKIKTLASSSLSIQTSGLNVTVQPAGVLNPMAVTNMQPYVVINYIISTSGIYPPRQ